MRIWNALLLMALVAGAGCKPDDTKNLTSKAALLTLGGGPIIANHAIVADYARIPPYYMAEVRKMMVAFPGESHSYAYRRGMELLEIEDPDYACNVDTGEAPTDQYVRVNYSGCGEAAWFTWYAWDDHDDLGGNKDVIKNLIAEYASHGHPIHAIGFGWCWDLTRDTLTTGKDPVFGCSWAGSSVGGPDGDRRWGLDSGDYAITLNRVSMDTYIQATEEYNRFCAANGYVTRAVFTTGPADGSAASGESGYQGYLKHERLRQHVASHRGRILFDYADIICYDDGATSPNTATWEGHIYPVITATNLGDGSVGHIGEAGAIRLAKAQWWMLARIAGWNGK